MAVAQLIRLLHSASSFWRAASLRLAALWSTSARARQHLYSKWEVQLTEAKRTHQAESTLWCHLSSPSDYAICSPIIAMLQAHHPDWYCLITAQNPTMPTNGELTNPEALLVQLPIDTPRNVQRFLTLASPAVAIVTQHHKQFVNFLIALHKKNIPTYLIAAKFSAPRIPIKRLRAQIDQWPSLYTRIFTIDSSSVDTLSKHGFTHVACAGNTIFDRIAYAQSKAFPHPIVAYIATQRNTIIAANITEKDESILLNLLWNLPQQWCLIALPNVINETRITAWMKRVNRTCCRASCSPSSEALSGCTLLLLDDNEPLFATYQLSAIAYIGGGFENQLSDCLIPSAYGIPMVFGAFHRNRPEALELRECNAAAALYKPSQIVPICLSLINSPTLRNHMGQHANDYFTQHTGSTDTIARRIEADIHLASTV